MTSLTLAPRLDLTQVSDMASAIRAHAGADLVLDAGQVTHLGGLGLQLLAASARHWRAGGHTLTISPRSPAFDEALAIFGVSLDDIQSEEAA
jgi:chemotaxis protein CheX